MAKIVSKARQLRLNYQAKLGRPVSVQEVAEATGISRKALNRIELNQTEEISFETLKKLCLFYGVEVGDILELSPEEIRRRGLVAAVQTSN